jgi:hypothetical protein
MGKLLYGTPPTEVDFDDRVLVHLQIVIGAKLRRRESFFFSWKNDVQVGDGRTSIWMDAAIPLAFKYSGGRVPIVNREWLDILTTSANSGSGLQYIPEPAGNGGGNGGAAGASTPAR